MVVESAKLSLVQKNRRHDEVHGSVDVGFSRLRQLVMKLDQFINQVVKQAQSARHFRSIHGDVRQGYDGQNFDDDFDEVEIPKLNVALI